MSNLNTHQLNVFLVAAETLNFTQAAQRLQMTQPSVSQHIQALEEHFGLELFARAGLNIELTDAGMALIPLARETVNLAMHLEEMMASLKGDLHGHLVVGCSSATGRYILPKLLASYHREYPQVRATCHVCSAEHVMQMLSEGRFHLALATCPGANQELEFSRFATEEIILIAPSNHPWARRDEIDPAELMEADFILPVEGSETHTALREELSRLGGSVFQLNTLMTLGSLEAIALSVQEGLGVGFVPRLVVSRLVRSQVVCVRVRGLKIERDIYIGRNVRRTATGAQSAFWDFIQQQGNQWLQNLPPLPDKP